MNLNIKLYKAAMKKNKKINQENKTQQEAHNKAAGKNGKTTLDWANPDKSKL